MIDGSQKRLLNFRIRMFVKSAVMLQFILENHCTSYQAFGALFIAVDMTTDPKNHIHSC